MVGIQISGADDLAALKEKCQKTRDSINMDMIRGMQFLPKSKEMWHNQYMYGSEDREGNVIPLTGEKIDSLLISPVYGQQSH